MSSLPWKRRIGRLHRRVQHSGDRRLVLLYHSVGDSPWAVKEEQFRLQVNWLEKNSRVESLDALLRDPVTPGLRVAITFDDGYSSLAAPGARILSDAGMTATVYLNTAEIDETRGRPSDAEAGHYPDEVFLTWAGVHDLQSLGWIIGSHGMQHVDLTVQSRDRVTAELIGSRQTIESRLGVRCRHFAYTWGRNSTGVREAVRDAGYEFAAAAVHGPLSGSADRFAFPRVNIHHDYSIEDFVAIVRGDWDFLGTWQAWRNRRS